MINTADMAARGSAARPMFGTRDLVWPGYSSSRELYLRSREYDFTKDKKKKTNRQTNTLLNLNTVIYCSWVIRNKSTFGNT